MTQWLKAVYALMQQLYPEVAVPGRPGRRWFSLAQAKAVGAFMRRLDFSIDTMRVLLEVRPDIREAAALRHVPGRWWLSKAKSALSCQERADVDISHLGFALPD